MKNSPIVKAFDDAEELTIERDDEGITKIKGIAFFNNVPYQISIRRNDTGSTIPKTEYVQPKQKPLYTGTISILDPAGTSVMHSEAKRRKREDAGKAYCDKDIYATIKYQCNSANEENISNILMRQINTLFLENSRQLDMAITTAMRPEQVTPAFAADKYSNEFLKQKFPGASPEKIMALQKKIKKVMNWLPCVPISKLSKRNVNSILDSHNVTNESRKICSDFFEYLIYTKKCTGKNPIKLGPKRDPSEFEQNKAAFTTQELGADVYKKMYVILSKKYISTYCAIALLASGFSREDIYDLKWSDCEFTKDKDFVIIHIQREYAGISKHDFSRPATIDTARYLNKAYQALSADDDTINEKYIFPKEDRKKIDLSNEVNNILVRAGFDGKLALPGRPGDGVESIPITVLQNNYRRMLYAKAGLKDDPDTLAFLSGQLLKSSTYTNYESHTSPEAQKRLFTILKPLAVEEKITKKSGVKKKNEKQLYLGVPKTTHEVARVSGSIDLPSGKSIIIRVNHGGTGYIEIVNCTIATQ